MSKLTLGEELEVAPKGSRLVRGDCLQPGDIVMHPDGHLVQICALVPDNGPEYFVYFTTTGGDFWIGRAASKVVYCDLKSTLPEG